jgi:hypothetical protein
MFRRRAGQSCGGALSVRSLPQRPIPGDLARSHGRRTDGPRKAILMQASTTGANPSLRRYRMAVASRAVAAIGGGYLLSAASANVGARALVGLGVVPADAALATTMLAFILHAVAAMWAFGCASAWRAWAVVCLPGAGLALLAWVLARGAAA